jgi:uncharacterized protein YcbK (DUF882 family)
VGLIKEINMGDLTKNISQYELNCKCGNCAVTIQAHEPVIKIWQDACDYFATKYGVDKVRLEITSAARCYVWNRTPLKSGGPGSNDESQHPRCSAIDGKIFVNNKQLKPREVFDYFDSRFHDACGVGLYPTFTHFDTRIPKARWGL